MSSVGSFVGDIFDTATNVVEKAFDYGGNLVEKTVGTVADLASDIDIKDAALTYITTGNPYAAAFAATDYDEELGFNPATFYNPSTGGFGFQDVSVGGGEMPSIFNEQAWNTIASTAINSLANYAQQRPSESQQYGQIGNTVLQSMSGILADVAAGKFSKSPASEYNTRSVLKSYYEGSDNSLSAGLLNDYASAKRKVAEMVETPSSIYGQVALEGNPFYNFMRERNIGQSRKPLQGLFEPFLEKENIMTPSINQNNLPYSDYLSKYNQLNFSSLQQPKTSLKDFYSATNQTSTVAPKTTTAPQSTSITPDIRVPTPLETVYLKDRGVNPIDLPNTATAAINKYGQDKFNELGLQKYYNPIGATGDADQGTKKSVAATLGLPRSLSAAIDKFGFDAVMGKTLQSGGEDPGVYVPGKYTQYYNLIEAESGGGTGLKEQYI